MDISLTEYDESRFEGVSYETAMVEMTVIDENNKASELFNVQLH